MFERATPYPDNIMPDLIYRKSMRETRAYAKAETRAKAKSAIPKYGEAIALTLEANFAIKLMSEFLRDYAHTRHASDAIGQLSMPSIPAKNAAWPHLAGRPIFESPEMAKPFFGTNIILLSTFFVFSSYGAISLAFLNSFSFIKLFLSFYESNFYLYFSIFIIH